jgi:hypothetical protein
MVFLAMAINNSRPVDGTVPAMSKPNPAPRGEI